METVIMHILAQALNIEAGHVIDGLLLIACFFIAMFIKDAKQTNKEIHTMYLDHDRRITRLEAKDE